MQYIHIRNLEKYNPGYTDRTLIWCKIYFTMLNSNYEFELIDDIDKWRLIALIMLELQMKKPIPYDEKWLQKKISNHKRPISLTIKMLHTFLELVTENHNPVTQSRVDKSRVDTDPANAVLNKVCKDGFNIYQCLNRLKKDLGFAKDFSFPNKVITKVCEQYFKDKPTKPWAWFVKVFASESEKYHAQENIRVNEESKLISFDSKIKNLIKDLAKET